METVAKFYKAEEAYLVRSFLESEDIEAHVFDEYNSRVHWLWTHPIGDIRVVVNAEDADRASALYRKYETNVKAGSPVVGDVKAWPAFFLVSFIVAIPLYFLGRYKGGEKFGNG